MSKKQRMCELVEYKPMAVIPYEERRLNRQFTALFGWGMSGSDQLPSDTEPNEDGLIPEPRHLQLFDGYMVMQAAIGLHHSLFLTTCGLYSTGGNEHGQLGHSKQNPSPGYIRGLHLVNIAAVAVGESHSLALSEDGVLYSWGSNQYGQLGRTGAATDEARPVQFAVQATITKIACGDNHCLALAKDGALYTWGCNKEGQLGHGSTGPIISQPQAITSVRNIHFIKVDAGGGHSFALSVSGALFGWGRNRNGQLGIGNTEDKPFPVCCRALRQQRVRHMKCGYNHSVALTSDGGVFTFGAGSHGQLGHNLSSDELLPKKVMELMGSVVTQISCGRYHTLALVASSNRVYSFGLGAHGQLGIGDVNKKLCPHLISGPWSKSSSRTSTSTSDASRLDYIVKRIFAGGNSSTAYAEAKGPTWLPTLDQRDTFSQQYSIDNHMVGQILSTPFNKRMLTLREETLISTVFSCPSIWNGAYLIQKDNSHYGCSSTNHGLDIDKAREELSSPSKYQNNIVNNLIYRSLEKHLLPAINSKIPDVEALRIFLLLPCLSAFSDPSNYSTIQSPYGNAFVNLDTSAAKVLNKWLTKVPPRHFKFYLSQFKKVASYVLCLDKATTGFEVLVRQRGVQICLEVMQTFYRINEGTGEQIVSCTDFYIPEIAEQVDIKADYINWHTQVASAATGQSTFSFCNYAFVFDAQAKTILLNADALLQMQQAIEQAHRLNLFNILSSSQIDPIHPCLVISVSRDNIVHDTIVSLSKHGSHDLKKPLKVSFNGEEAVDEGGVKKEFFLLLIREILDVKYGMFVHHTESRLLWFNPATFEEDMYRLIGILCGLAIYNTTIIDLPFPLALYKKLLKRDVNLDDLRELDPTLGKSLQDLLDYEGDDVESVFSLTFSVSSEFYGQVSVHDLIPSGRNVDVTNDNRQEYVDKYVDYVFNESVKSMFDEFYDGFHKVCGGRVLSFFHPMELQAMVVGNQEYDWEELEKNCNYKGEFYRYHPTIDMFWDIFSEFSHDQKKQFLLYLTGCDRIPIQGMKALRMTIQPMHTSDEYLPVAHTCFNLLDLPKQYLTREKMRSKLLQAIDNTQGFGLI